MVRVLVSVHQVVLPARLVVNGGVRACKLETQLDIQYIQELKYLPRKQHGKHMAGSRKLKRVSGRFAA